MNGNIIELNESYFDGISFFLIWYEDENNKDCVYTSDGKVVIFPSEEKAHQKAEKLGITVMGTCLYDIEHLFYWIETHSKETECNFLIDFWNLFSDIAYSVGKELEPIKTRRSERCYNKLFCGLNLLAVEGCEYKPFFTKKERKFIREIMRIGLEIFDKNSEWEEDI